MIKSNFKNHMIVFVINITMISSMLYVVLSHVNNGGSDSDPGILLLCILTGGFSGLSAASLYYSSLIFDDRVEDNDD